MLSFRISTVLLFLGLPAYADVSGFTAPGSLSDTTFVPGGNQCCNLGMVFTADSNITVDALGLYAIPGQIPAAGDTVVLYNSSGSLLAQTTVTSSDAVVNGYYYHGIASVVLSAGQQYTVNEFGTSGEWAYTYVAAPTTNPGITFDHADYSFATSLTFPTSTASAPESYYGPNIFFTTAAPEPASLFLFGTALLGFILQGAVKRRFFVVGAGR